MSCYVCGGTNCIDNSHYDGEIFSYYPLSCANGCTIKCICGNICKIAQLKEKEIRQINDVIDYLYTYNIICENCEKNLCLDYCKICMKSINTNEKCCKTCINEIEKIYFFIILRNLGFLSI